MEIVTLVEISLNRIGTAQNAGNAFRANQSRVVFAEAEDAEIETVREVVIKAAQANGETGALDALKHEPSYGTRIVAFNIQGETSFTARFMLSARYFQRSNLEAAISDCRKLKRLLATSNPVAI